MSAANADLLRPVTVLTGFLGSGKTTTLARLLKAPEFAGTVAIINEFGEIGLDHLLIETSEERFALLDNGCVCCTVRDDLVETLLCLVARAAAGELPDFRRVVVETTGLADPAPILHALMAEPRLTDAYRIDGVVATVDAVNGLATLKAHQEAVKQAAIADRLLVTKTDLAAADELARLLSRLSQLNPTATVIPSREGDAPAAALIGVGLEAGRGGPGEIVDWFERATAPPRFRAEVHDTVHDTTCGDPRCTNPSHGRRHGEGISTFSIIIDHPVEWGAFRRWLEYLAMLKGEDLLRFKGLIQIAERPDTPIVVHGVQHVFHPPRELTAWPSADRRTRLVFITRNISRSLIENTLSKFAAIDVARMHRPAARCGRSRSWDQNGGSHYVVENSISARG
jgi:G3E family GTPase